MSTRKMFFIPETSGAIPDIHHKHKLAETSCQLGGWRFPHLSAYYIFVCQDEHYTSSRQPPKMSAPFLKMLDRKV